MGVSLAVVTVSMGLLFSAMSVSAQGAPAAAAQGEIGPGVSSSSRAEVPTGPVPRLPDGTVDLDGVWQGGGPVGDISQQEKPGVARPRAATRAPGEIPLLPWAKALLDSRNREDDPHAWCLPMGVPRVAGAYPWRFVQNYTHRDPTHMFILHEGNIHSYRQIFLDGRPLPEDPDPTWYGHSVGTWEGDTLVVESVGFNDRFWFDFAGHPHTEQLRTVERFRRPDANTLEYEVTVDDPGAYTAPFTLYGTHSYAVDTELMEYICNENNQDVSHIVGKDPRNRYSREQAGQ
jgi:hypothetical protein